MQTEMALQKLNELRQVVDGDMAEMVDTMATLVTLRQDITHPMLGSKVTFYEKPEGEWIDVDFDYYRNEIENGDLLPDDVEEAWEMSSEEDTPFVRWEDEPWYLRWRRIDGDNNKTVPDGTIEHRLKRYFGYGEKQKIERDEVPDPLSPDNSLAKDCNLARELEESEGPGSQWHGDWHIYEKDFREYRFTPYVEVEEYVPRRAIVIEASIAEQSSDTEFWDPNKQEYTTPDDYPMGTVNLVVSDDRDDEFGRDYVYETRVETSVTPAKDGTNGHVYTPGWEDID